MPQTVPPEVDQSIDPIDEDSWYRGGGSGRRRHVTRSRVEPLHKINREHLRIIQQDTRDYDSSIRPKVRLECLPHKEDARPCPFVSCRHHLYLEVAGPRKIRQEVVGNILINFPDLEPDQIPETCSLDIADRGGVTLEEVGMFMNVSRERIRQIETQACKMLSSSTGILARWEGYQGYHPSPSPLAEEICDSDHSDLKTGPHPSTEKEGFTRKDLREISEWVDRMFELVKDQVPDEIARMTEVLLKVERHVRKNALRKVRRRRMKESCRPSKSNQTA